MKYWPFAQLAPLLPPEINFEIRCWQHTGKLASYVVGACARACQQVEPPHSPNMVIIESNGAPWRRVYVDYPTFDEWMALERGGVIEDTNATSLWPMIDALH